jgi:hypothetical protein
MRKHQSDEVEKHEELNLARNPLSTYTIDMKGNAFSLNAVCMRLLE